MIEVLIEGRYDGKGLKKFITVLLFNLVCFVLIFPIQIFERERDCGCQSIVSDLFSRVDSWIVQLLIVRYLLLLYLIGNNKLSELSGVLLMRFLQE